MAGVEKRSFLFNRPRRHQGSRRRLGARVLRYSIITYCVSPFPENLPEKTVVGTLQKKRACSNIRINVGIEGQRRR